MGNWRSSLARAWLTASPVSWAPPLRTFRWQPARPGRKCSRAWSWCWALCRIFSETLPQRPGRLFGAGLSDAGVPGTGAEKSLRSRPHLVDKTLVGHPPGGNKGLQAQGPLPQLPDQDQVVGIKAAADQDLNPAGGNLRRNTAKSGKPGRNFPWSTVSPPFRRRLSLDAPAFGGPR